jgi:hypothetical protein
MAKVKVTIIVSTSDANATSRFTNQYLKEVLEGEFFDSDDDEVIESVEAEILEEN